MMKDEQALPHNVIRFDVRMGHVYPMIDEGDLDMSSLIAKLRKAIIDIVNEETEWQVATTVVRATGGTGLLGGVLHDEEISYDFS